MASSFDELLSKLHDSITENPTDNTNLIEVDQNRQFSVTEGFNTVVAYEGDINSQIITIKIPSEQDGHSLQDCNKKELRWRNMTSGVEAISELKTISGSPNFYQWILPSEACTSAGVLEISICFYDVVEDKILFSWNTSTYNGLSIGKSMDSVGFVFPAKDEILVIDKDTKSIIAPAGYNNTICNYGDVGVAEVYFLIPRYLGKSENLDVMNANTAIYIVINGYKRKQIEYITKQLYTEEYSENKGGLVFIKWEVPAEITAGDFGSVAFDIAIEFAVQEGDNFVKRWFTNIYSKLNIGRSMVQIEVNPGEPQLTEDKVYELITNYFEANEIIWES